MDSQTLSLPWKKLKLTKNSSWQYFGTMKRTNGVKKNSLTAIWNGIFLPQDFPLSLSRASLLLYRWSKMNTQYISCISWRLRDIPVSQKSLKIEDLTDTIFFPNLLYITLLSTILDKTEKKKCLHRKKVFFLHQLMQQEISKCYWRTRTLFVSQSQLMSIALRMSLEESAWSIPHSSNLAECC